MRIFDISLAIASGLPTWPTSEGYRLRSAMRIAAGDPANVTVVEMDVHTGTHVEAPLHFISDGDGLDSIELERFVGPAVVVVVDGSEVTAALLAAANVPPDAERLLIRTSNSERWAAGGGPFDPGYVSLTEDAAAWVVRRGIRLVGIDYLSIQQFDNDGETHRILMRAGVAILEGLDLHDVAAGSYTLVAAPIRLAGVEAAPTRALLIDGAP